MLFRVRPFWIQMDLLSKKKKKQMDGMEMDAALFSSKIFYKIGTVALSFVCDKYCPVMY